MRVRGRVRPHRARGDAVEHEEAALLVRVRVRVRVRLSFSMAAPWPLSFSMG